MGNNNQFRGNNHKPLQWEQLAIFTSEKEVRGRHPACLVQVASVGADKCIFSYSLGWEDAGQFMPSKYLPDAHIEAFQEQLAIAASEAKVGYLNARKAQQGALAASLREQLGKRQTA